MGWKKYGTRGSTKRAGACGRPPNKPIAAGAPGGRWGSPRGMRSSDGAPFSPCTPCRVFFIGFVSLIHSLTSGKTRANPRQSDVRRQTPSQRTQGKWRRHAFPRSFFSHRARALLAVGVRTLSARHARRRTSAHLATAPVGVPGPCASDVPLRSIPSLPVFSPAAVQTRERGPYTDFSSKGPHKAVTSRF